MLDRGGGYIVNLDSSDPSQPGTHWVAAWKMPRLKTVLWADSYGFPPPQEMLENHPDLKFYWTDARNQPLDEVNCGIRSLNALQILSEAKNKRATFKRIFS